ncbi:MAG TPA: hypothetical protein VKB50_05570 [Vicinamibacterales bacterium]|nr:hypothetical protein [Vicinamibacterales bacterium]
MDDIRLLLITGTMGAGKTTLMAEASDVLIERRVVHAAIDLDALGIGLMPPSEAADIDQRADGKPRSLEDLMYRNLALVWQNYRSAGVTKIVVAAAIDRRDLPFLQAALDRPDTTICRIRAPLSVMQDRVRLREPGLFQTKGIKRVAELEALLDQAAIEDFTLTNHEQSITDLAVEMLKRARFI